MLAEHLRQDHDAASRRFAKIDEQVRWIHETLLDGRPTCILDLACGPGLYTSRFAALGHECAGIDFAPAAIGHARDVAARDGLACSYTLADLRAAAFGEGFGLVMLLFGQFNVFRRAEAASILERAFAATTPGGHLLLEPQRFDAIASDRATHTSWYTAAAGLFSPRPHLCLQEHFWDEQARASTERWHIVDAESSEVTRYALTNEAYTDDELVRAVEAAGFADVRLLPSLIGVDDKSQSHSLAVTARKPA
jgi:SAM-dependent methyltransferase